MNVKEALLVLEEEIGTTENEKVKEALTVLNNIKYKIENGTLIELPCKVGDTVYYLRPCYEWVEGKDRRDYKLSTYEIIRAEITIVAFKYKQTNGNAICHIVFEWKDKWGESQEHTCHIDKLGKEYFSTKEEAEAKLKELKNE